MWKKVVTVSQIASLSLMGDYQPVYRASQMHLITLFRLDLMACRPKPG